jgi:hypothetical protein
MMAAMSSYRTMRDSAREISLAICTMVNSSPAMSIARPMNRDGFRNAMAANFPTSETETIWRGWRRGCRCCGRYWSRNTDQGG